MPEQILVTYFKFNSLGFEFGKPVKPIFLPHLGLTKDESQWFSGYCWHVVDGTRRFLVRGE
jgi:hypothetical protein